MLLNPTPEKPEDCAEALDADPDDGLQGFENVLVRRRSSCVAVWPALWSVKR